MVADIVCFLDSCFDFSVKSSIFCKYVTEVLELGHLLELSAIDVGVEFAGCSAHLHRLGLADADFHVVFFTGYLYAICMLFVCYLYAICMLFVCYLYAICMLFVCYLYAICMLFVCYLYAICMLFVCYLYAICMLFVCYLYAICMLFVCYLYAICMLFVCYLYACSGYLYAFATSFNLRLPGFDLPQTTFHLRLLVLGLPPSLYCPCIQCTPLVIGHTLVSLQMKFGTSL